MVVRLKLKKQQHRRLARLCPGCRATKELVRAVERPGLTAELTATEIFNLAERPLPPDLAEPVQAAAALAREGELREAVAKRHIQEKTAAIRARNGAE